MLAEGAQTPLETLVVRLQRLILDKVIVLLIYRIVCQVNIHVVFVDFVTYILLAGKSGKAFLVDIDAEGFKAGNDAINTQVELMTVDQ